MMSRKDGEYGFKCGQSGDDRPVQHWMICGNKNLFMTERLERRMGPVGDGDTIASAPARSFRKMTVACE